MHVLYIYRPAQVNKVRAPSRRNATHFSQNVHTNAEKFAFCLLKEIFCYRYIGNANINSVYLPV